MTNKDNTCLYCNVEDALDNAVQHVEGCPNRIYDESKNHDASVSALETFNLGFVVAYGNSRIPPELADNPTFQLGFNKGRHQREVFNRATRAARRT